MDLITQFFVNLLMLANGMSMFILLGLLIAGVLKEITPADFISKHLGQSKISSVIKATLLGIPMPVCSCSVIPLAKSLQKEGASKGAVQSFLISTPITGADSIMVTYGFFGWIFTLFRVVTSIIIAITAGVLQNILDGRQPKQAPLFSATPTGDMAPLAPSHDMNLSCSSPGCCDTATHGKDGFSIIRAVNYAFVTLFKDIYKSLFSGILVGALFTTLLPKELLAPLFEYQFITYIAVLIIAMPMYVCATTSLPIAAAFLLSGMSGGAAFVFLSAGPATNTVTMGVVGSMFGKKSLALYLATISILSIMFGFIYDHYFAALQVLDMHEFADNVSVADYISTAIMFALMLYYFFRRR